MSKIILTGDRPTGRLHVGHYVGSLKESYCIQSSEKSNCKSGDSAEKV